MNNFDLKKFLTENKLTSNSRLNEGSTVDGSTMKIVDGPIGASKFTDALKAQTNLPTPPPLPQDVLDAIKAYVDDPKSSFEDFGTGKDSTATKATEALSRYVLNNKKLAAADKGYYVNQFNTMVMSKKKGTPPPPLPAGAKKGRVRAAKGTPPPPPPLPNK